MRFNSIGSVSAISRFADSSSGVRASASRTRSSTIRLSPSAQECWKFERESTRMAKGIFQASAVISSTMASVWLVKASPSGGSRIMRMLSFLV